MTGKKSYSQWYPRDVGDYARKTKHLSMMEHGAYNLLLDHYYATSSPLPANAEQLHRICSAVAESEQAVIAKVLQQFFVLKDGLWHNERADEELAKRKEISKKRSNSAKTSHSKGKRKSPRKESANAPANADTLTPTVLEGSDEPSTPIPPALEIPDWIPKTDWNGWVAMRKANRKPLKTSEAQRLAVSELEKLKASGHDPGAVLRQSTLCGWTGLFEIKEAQNGRFIEQNRGKLKERESIAAAVAGVV